MPFQILIYHLVLVITAAIFSSSVKSGIVILLELFSQRGNHILHSLHKGSSIKNRFRYSAPRTWSNIKNTVVLTILNFPAHSVFIFDVCWDSLGASIFRNSSSTANNTRCPDYLPDYLFVSDDYEITMITRQMTPFFSSALRALFVGIFHFGISRPSKFSFGKSPSCIMFWSVKYICTCKRWHFQAC